METVHETVLSYSQGVKVLAENLGKAPSTIYNETNPNPEEGRTHKLGLMDWLRLVKETRDHRSLHRVCGELGFVAVAAAQAPREGAGWLRLQARAARDHGEAAAQLMEALSEESPAGESLCREERERCAREAYEAAQASMALYLALRDEA